MVLDSENTRTNIIFPLKVAGKMMKSFSTSGIYVRFLNGGIPLEFFFRLANLNLLAPEKEMNRNLGETHHSQVPC